MRHRLKGSDLLWTHLNPTRTLKARLGFVFGGLALLLAAIFSIIVGYTTTSQLSSDRGQHLMELAYQMTDKLDRGMFERYRDIQILATLDTIGDSQSSPADLRMLLEELQSTYPAYAWIGFADAQGIVRVSTDGLLEGADVSERPWFTEALQTPFVGDVHEAVLLAQLLPNSGGEPLRFVDVAAPVVDAQGNLQGVLGAHLSWSWAEEVKRSLLDPLRERSNIDMLVLSQDGTVILGPSSLSGQRLELASVERARTDSGYIVETWPDGGEYLTGYSTSTGYRTYPGLGWLVLVRQDTGEAFAPARQLRDDILGLGAVLGLCFAAVGWMLAGRVAQPMLAIAGAAERIRRGDAAVKIPAPQGQDEVATLATSLQGMVDTLKAQEQTLATLNEQLRADIAERERVEAALRRHAFYDPLTDLPNRALFMDRLQHALEHTKRHPEQRFAVLLLDLDRFKTINDSLGHVIGDKLLQTVAHRLSTCLRPTDTVARLGGDEFLILLEDLHDISDAIHIADRILHTVALPIDLDGHSVVTDTSIGIVMSTPKYEQPQELLRDADTALYRAKTMGKARYAIFDTTMHAHAMRMLHLEHELRRALEQEEFTLFYQPIVGLPAGAITGVEALVRWDHPQHGMISPAEFIPLAEETGLIVPLGEWVLHTACMQIKAWQAAGLPSISLAVNVSARQFKHAGILEMITRVIEETQIDPQMLKLELTESCVWEQADTIEGTLRGLSETGVQFSIDDFGTGYSSLGYLKHLPITTLKIDKSFIHNIALNTNDSAIVTAMIAMAHRLDLQVVAEGVETEEQRAFLDAHRCDALQGYLFNPPLPAESITRVLQSN